MSGRKFIYVIASVIFILSAAQISLAQFEGIIEMTMTVLDGGTPQIMEYSMMVKKDLVCSVMKQGAGAETGGKFIFRGDKKLLWILNESEKNYLEISFNSREEKQNTGEGKNLKTKVVKSGKTETILGYRCEEVIVEEADEMTHIWGTAMLGNFYHQLMKSLGGFSDRPDDKAQAGWESEIEALKLFPLKIISKTDGIVRQSQQVTKIESKKIAPELFEIPAGFTKLEMGLDMDTIMSEPDKDDPGVNVEMEKMMKQMQDAGEDSSGGRIY